VTAREPGGAPWPLGDSEPVDLPAALSRRVGADPESVEQGLVQLVLTLVELLRQLMERQAIRRMDAGGLSDDEIERLGRTLMLLEEKMGELRDHFGLRPEDLNLDLGPLGRLL
jgi:hypothetical protein